MAQKVMFIHCPDATEQYMKNLQSELADNMDTNKYMFIISSKQINTIDRDELLRALQQ